jgi:hypothetical protein
MASGELVDNWIGKAAACPAEFPFWTKIVLPGGEEFVCLDRGGAITILPGNVFWVDLLVKNPPVPYGTIVDVRVVLP